MSGSGNLRRGLRVIKFALIGLWAAVSVGPVAVIYLNSFKTSLQIISTPPVIFFTPTLEGYGIFFFREFAAPLIGSIRYLPLLMANSLTAAALGTIVGMAVGVPAGYSLSFLRLHGRRVVLALVMCIYTMPPAIMAFSLLVYTRNLGLYDNIFTVALVDATLVMPFTIWLTKAFFDALPREIHDAALVDGCSPIQALTRIVLPQTIGGLTVAGLFAFVAAWGEFIVARTITERTNVTALAYIDEFDELIVIGLKWSWLAVLFALYTLPPLIIAYLMRNHLLLALTLGTVKEKVRKEV